MDYIFGYGSIINDSSRIATSTTYLSAPHSQQETLSTNTKTEIRARGGECSDGKNVDAMSGGNHDLAVAARLCPHFARRVWNFRCPTGFTALGVVLNEDEYDSGSGEMLSSLSSADCSASSSRESGTVPQGMNGVLFPVTSHHDLTAFDIREVGYTRISIPLNRIHMLLDMGCPSAQARAERLQSIIMRTTTASIRAVTPDKAHNQPRIWMYVPDSSHTASPSVEYPILQTYVDVCLEGCLQWGGEAFAIEFLRGTSNWSEFYLNDTPLSRRPWLHRKDYKRVDACLQSVSSVIQFTCRKHPDEFASLHLTSLKGMFGVPPRNRTFIGRESFLQSVHMKLADLSATQTEESQQSMESMKTHVQLHTSDDPSFNCTSASNNMLKQVEISGIGGVGKSQIAIEYAHRHYSASCYALVAWFRAESAASIATDMRKLAFDLGIIQDRHRSITHDTAASVSVGEDKKDASDTVRGSDLDMDAGGEGTDTAKDLEEYDDVYIINELMRRLGLCRFKWLFIFDNLEDPSILPAYLPRGVGGGAVGGGCGHVVVTSRIQHFDWMLRGSALTLDCFETLDSVRYVQQTLGILCSQNNTNMENSDDGTIRQLSLRMGNLPLALSIAVAYMVRCDVSPGDYLKHVNSSSGGNMDAISTSLNVTLKRIGEECHSAAAVLPCLGYFAPDNISKDMIQLFLLSAHYLQDGPQAETIGVLQDDALQFSVHEENDKDPRRIPSAKHNNSLHILKMKHFDRLVVGLSVAWMAVLINGYNSFDRSGASAMFSDYGCFVLFALGMITGCVFMLDVITLFCWLQPQYCLCLKVEQVSDLAAGTELATNRPLSPYSSLPPPPPAIATAAATTSTTSALLSQLPPSDSDRFVHCANMIDERQVCKIDSVITSETDTIWEIMKQFSLLSIRGGKGHGCVHRLQQVVLRAAHDTTVSVADDKSGVERSFSKVLCIERCIWVLSKLWKFNQNDSLSWQKAGDIIEHIQVIAKHAIDILPTTNSIDEAKVMPSIREEYYLLLSVLLKEGGVYISMVLSRFDSAQQLLEWSHHIQTYLMQSSPTSGPECQKFNRAEDVFQVQFLEKLNDSMASTLYILGKVLRYNDQLVESEFVLKQSLKIRKNKHDLASISKDHSKKIINNNGASADILHELGVLYLRKHDLYTAKSYLTRSLDMKYDTATEIQETNVSSTLHQLGVVATLERRYDDAEALLLQALEVQDHHDIKDLANSHQKTISSASTTATSNHKSIKHLSAISSNMTSRAATLQQLGRVELRRGRLSQADVFLTEALELYTVAYGVTRAASHVNVAGVRHQLGAAAMAAKHYDKACEHFSIALAAREIICSQSSGGKDQVTAELLALGQGEVERGRYTSADTLFLRAKSSLEMDLCSSTQGPKSIDNKGNSTIPLHDAAKEKGTHNYSSEMLAKCGYGQDGQDRINVEDTVSYERKRDTLIKQLFFCVHLLRGVARQRGDTEATMLYSVELKGLSKKYPSHRHAKKHMESRSGCTQIALSTDESNDSSNSPPHVDKTADIFQADSIVVASQESQSVVSTTSTTLCRSELRADVTLTHGVPLSSVMRTIIPQLVIARCNIRQQCKTIQSQTYDDMTSGSEELNQEVASRYNDILKYVCTCLSSDTGGCLQTQPHERIVKTVQAFLSKVESRAVTSSSPHPSCTKKVCLSILYQLSDDLRKDITSYGFRLEDM